MYKKISEEKVRIVKIFVEKTNLKRAENLSNSPIKKIFVIISNCLKLGCHVAIVAV